MPAKDCDVCSFTENLKFPILVTDKWTVDLGNNQAYLGRAFVTLRTHKPSLSELSKEEWQDFEEVVRKLEKAYKKAFVAEPLNWGCFMNNAYRSLPGNPHVHWHIFPRYKTAPIFEGITFADPLYGEFYDDHAELIVSDEILNKIAIVLKANIH